jgi:hypothetical protein
MLNATAAEFGWKTVLLALATRNRDIRLANGDEADQPAPNVAEPVPDDAEPFQLDDTEMAERLSPNRVQPTHANTPPHAHLMFPMLGRLVR